MIFWDLDGVLANFNKAAKQLIIDADKELPAESDWHYLSNPLYKWQVEQIATDPEFWINLEPIPEAVEAFNMVKDRAMILSSPGFPVSATPKLQWCRKHLGLKECEVILASAKHVCADYNRFLIDDKSSNCVDWVKAGGNAILVHHPYSLKDADYTLLDMVNMGIEVVHVCDLPEKIGELFGC